MLASLGQLQIYDSFQRSRSRRLIALLVKKPHNFAACCPMTELDLGFVPSAAGTNRPRKPQTSMHVLNCKDGPIAGGPSTAAPPCLVHFWCTVFGETACIPYRVICDILFDGAATSRIGLQRPALTNADWLHWLTCYIFTRECSYCFHHVLAIAFLSIRLSVCPSVGHTGGSVKSDAS